MSRLKDYTKYFEEVANGQFEYLGRRKGDIKYLHLKCKKCGGDFYRTLQVFQQNNFQCPICGEYRRYEKKGPDGFLREMHDKGLDEKWEILDIENYTNYNGGLLVRCKICGREVTRSPKDLFQYNCKCNRSISEKEAKKRVQEKFNGDIEIVKYNGWKELGEFYCHRCNTFSKKVPANVCIKDNVLGCAVCWQRQNVGKNHPSWTGGTLEIDDYLRNAVRTWRDESAFVYNNKCIITQDTTDIDIHHLSKNFLEIRDEVFEEFGLNKFTVVEEIDSETLIKVRDRVKQLHYELGYGIPLSKEVHKEFHRNYSRSNNTVDQLIEFAATKGVTLIKTFDEQGRIKLERIEKDNTQDGK